jgi:antitoxin component YwqK of YwqJK toxin-antitoxin module
MKSLKIKFLSTCLFLAGFMLIMPFHLAAQNDVPTGDFPNMVDAAGKKQGKWKKMDEQGTCIYVGQFKNDKPYGIFTYFDTDGKKMTEMNFLDGGPVAYGKMYSVSGKLQAQGKYVNQQKDSVWTFYTEDGLLLSQERYKNGKKDGKSVTYYPGTKQAAEVTYFKNGLEDSVWVQYYEDGKKKGEGNYKNGNYNGRAVWYFQDGKINIIGNYVNGLKDGNWVYYWLNPDKSMAYEIKGKETWKLGKITSGAEIIKKDDFNKQIEEQQPDPNGGVPGGGQ